MGKKLRQTELEIIQLLLLDKWNPGRINKKIASHFGLTVHQVKYLRAKPVFKAEYAKQMAIFKGEFDEIALADRVERVRAMEALYDRIPSVRVALKLKVLDAIRREMGDDRPVPSIPQEVPVVGVNVPPRAETYETWVEQNQLMQGQIEQM